MLDKTAKHIVASMEDEYKEPMEQAPRRFRYPQVFRGGLLSGEFKVDRKALAQGWTKDLLYLYWSTMYDPNDIESNYDY